jgi:hypothetical protein
MDTQNHAGPFVLLRKNKNNASWVFIMVLSNFFVLMKHKKHCFADQGKAIEGKTMRCESCDQTMQITGVGDD